MQRNLFQYWPSQKEDRFQLSGKKNSILLQKVCCRQLSESLLLSMQRIDPTNALKEKK
jgi:hypothetical protein